jgi:hypothetical protein
VSVPPKMHLKVSLEVVIWLRSIASNASSSALASTQPAEGASGDGWEGIPLNTMAIFGVGYFFVVERRSFAAKNKEESKIMTVS